MFQNAYANCKVFITGHTGFKGSWMCLWLERLGAIITGFSLPDPPSPNHFELLEFSALRSLQGDVRDFNALSSALEHHSPDIVFHLAAQPLVRRSYAKPLETFQTNLFGTANLLEAVRTVDSVKAVVVITSDKCYQNTKKNGKYAETDPLGGHDPYSASKACAEIVANSYKLSFFSDSRLPLLATVRAGNVIGGGDWAEDRLIPDLVRAAVNGHPADIRNPRACRPWQHVLDPLAGYLELGRRLLDSDDSVARAFNFGPDDHDILEVGDLAELFAAHWDRVRLNLHSSSEGPHETCTLRLDSALAKGALGWKPVWDVRTAIAKAAQWYKEHLRSQLLTREHLDCYVDDARRLGMPWAREEL